MGDLEQLIENFNSKTIQTLSVKLASGLRVKVVHLTGLGRHIFILTLNNSQHSLHLGQIHRLVFRWASNIDRSITRSNYRKTYLNIFCDHHLTVKNYSIPLQPSFEHLSHQIGKKLPHSLSVNELKFHLVFTKPWS